MKYDYNQDIKDVVLVTDDKERPRSKMKILFWEYKKRFHQPDSLREIVEHYEIG